jgi:hypothetical protein
MLNGILSGSFIHAIISGRISGPIVPLMCWRRLLRNAYKGGLYLRARLREL